MKLEIHHFFHTEDENLLSIKTQLTAIETMAREILRKMANQEQDLQAILAAVKTMKAAFQTVSENLASANERIGNLEALLADDTNQNITDEVAALKEELGLATEAAEEGTEAANNAGGETAGGSTSEETTGETAEAPAGETSDETEG